MFNFKDITTDWYWLLAVLAVAAVIIAAAYFITVAVEKRKGITHQLSTRDIVYAAVCIAIGYSLSFFGYTLPFGGTITPFSLVPIIVYCYFFGFRRGLLVCTVFMLLQLLQNPQILHPFSFVLDYVLPYMLVCITGIFSYSAQRASKRRNAITAHYPLWISCVVYVIIRYILHVLSGVFFWYTSAPEGMNYWVYSLSYNSFVFVDMALALIGLFGLLCSKSFNRTMTSHRDTLQHTDSAAKNN